MLASNIPFDAKANKPGMHYVPQAFSPDGSTLLLATAPDNGPDAPGGDIAVLGAAVLGSDGKVTELVCTGGDPYMCFSALWSSDGSQVLCSSYGAFNGQPALWSQPATGGEPKILLASGKDNGQADVFSPIAAGDKIWAFVWPEHGQRPKTSATRSSRSTRLARPASCATKSSTARR